MNAQETNLDSQTFTVLDTMTGEVVLGLRGVSRDNSHLMHMTSVMGEKPWTHLEVNEEVCVKSFVYWDPHPRVYRIVRVS